MAKIKFFSTTVYTLIVIFQIAHCRSIEDKTDDVNGTTSHREARYFPFWGGGKSSGTTCTIGVGAAAMSGTCQTSKYCKIKGGANLGNCENNNGVCCQFSAKCPTNGDPCIIRESGALITQEQGMYNRRYVFPKIKGACQLKLELTTLLLAPPSAVGNCETDTLSVSGSPTVKRFTICGSIAEKQDLYFDYGTSENINMDINIRGAMGAMYSIRPTFIRCDSSKRVPSHCLQYFKGQAGMVKSFNEGQQQLNNMEYTVCVEPLQDTSYITWRECGPGRFFVTGNPGNPIGAVEGEQCVTDWVEIFGGKRHCGTAFIETTSVAKPYLLQVRFDDNDRPAGGISVNPGETCVSNNLAYTCMFVTDPLDPTKQVCQCTLNDAAGQAMNLESLNTGFCLEYVQM